MAEMLLINPRRRKAVRRAPTKTKRRRRATPAARVIAKSPVRRRRRNPIANLRRRNPISTRRRRRNPIGGGSSSKLSVKSILNQLTDAAIGGAGAVGLDVAWSYVNPMLPAMMRQTPGRVGVGDAVKAVATVALGTILKRATKGMSQKLAQGSLTVQMHGIVSQFVPPSLAGGVAGVGYASPARIVQGAARVGPMRTGVNAYIPQQRSPLLAAYTKPGAASPLLSGVGRFRGAREREGFGR